MGPQLSLDSVVVATTGQVSSDLAGETVILNMSNGMYYGLDSIGTAIWNEIAAPKRISDVRDSLLQQFDVESDRCGREVLELLEKLLAEGLVTLQAGAAQDK